MLGDLCIRFSMDNAVSYGALFRFSRMCITVLDIQRRHVEHG